MKIRVHATIANFGPGFDVFGVGIGEPYDELSFRESSEWEIRVKGHDVPADVRNTAVVAARALAEMAGEEVALRMKLRKGIRPRSGLGSSGASSLAGALAMARVLGVEDERLILRAAMEGERAASGSAHGDNVVPAYYGDFTILESYEPLRVRRIPVDFDVVAVLPAVEIPTSEARRVLPPKIPLKDAVRNIALASSLVLALKENDLKAVGRLLDDRIALPYRKRLMPWYDRARKAALEAGAYGFSVSGSGPAVFAVGGDVAQIGKAVAEAFEGFGIEVDVYVTKAGRGALWF
ncbi:homoserine kinase [Thermococcus gammatolerans]|uniref:Homoserine kinase n=1 Tax=Thermococcus gammatolerans (strain DSM 15229 / JCM 11827 / EJ3) TaxID=593117 RepID=KHSE_THEGJ|nr:homoserine kinase [Thermococcus gammatolerans]C5A1P1.1 RecName: Full=Homoserine kinase; Short=HK; Short=HSK [Thermococcus gammatolerans EJ3]ACS34310.1 Homoserine kinase (thrB) [Thermococcus gammatolerans EJ3]